MARRVSVLLALITAVLTTILSITLLPLSIERIDVISNFWPYIAFCLLLTSLLGIVFGRLGIHVIGIALSLYVFAIVFNAFGERADVAPAASVTLKFVTFNVFEANARPEDVAAFLEAENADFVFVEEAEGLYAALDRLRAVYPFQTEPYLGCQRPPDTSCDTIILSKHPLDNIERQLTPAGRDRFLIATTTVEGRSLTLAAVHLTKPLEAGQQAEEIELIGRRVRELPRPLIAAGDFNAAPWSKALSRFRRLASVRFPYGFRPTWPIWLPWLGLPIDHIMLSGNISLRDATTRSDPLGSNHRPLIATLTWSVSGR